jgi:hypothetical protein
MSTHPNGTFDAALYASLRTRSRIFRSTRHVPRLVTANHPESNVWSLDEKISLML